ncbi:MAG: SH3 beta-barrel fold-containing protein [Prevotella sp.]|jgi:hypothetical protein|nr:SH3 beta-barrel fold-containing protein [Prevotella sp.]MCI1474394.1 SH3 beta-barrel fold-containing protein [Prevotella sp.]
MNKAKVCKMAISLIRDFGFGQSEAMIKAWQVMKLEKAMTNKVVTFWYVKKTTGELREAHGTTDPHRYNYAGKGVGHKGNFQNCVQYWDTEKQGFRMFKTYNFVKAEL